MKVNLTERKKQEKGITLVALVVTIVVLLILAGITIMALTGEDGLIATAKRAKTVSKIGEIEDYATIKISELYTKNPDNIDAVNDATIRTALKAGLESQGYETKDVNTSTETVSEIKLTATDDTGANIDSITLQQQQTKNVKVGLNINSQVLSTKTYVKIYDDWHELQIANKKVSVAREKTEIVEESGNTYEIKITLPKNSGITMTVLGEPITSETPISPDAEITIKAGNTTGTFKYTLLETVSSKSKDLNITVSANPEYSTSLSIKVKNDAKAEITPGGELQLEATKSAGSTDQINWSIRTEDTNVRANASITDGLLTVTSNIEVGKTITVVAKCVRSDGTETTVPEATKTITVVAGGYKLGDIVEAIELGKEGVAYYADLESDGAVTVDGVIFADQSVGGSGEYGTNGYGTYTVPTVDNLKSYYIKQESYEGKFGTGPVIAPKADQSSDKNDRFYVMTLRDVIEMNAYRTGFYWDYNYDPTYNSKYYGTLIDFGTGKSNTKIMMEWWDDPSHKVEKPVFDWVSSGSSEEYVQVGTVTIASGWRKEDIWANIEKEYSNGWFVPSRAELACFGNTFKIDSYDRCSSLGLFSYYWSSSQITDRGSSVRAWNAYFDGGYICDNGAFRWQPCSSLHDFLIL